MILPLALNLYVSAQRNGLRASTQQGDVVGTLSAPSVRQWLGIPYAAAERWKAPVSPVKRNWVFNASAFGDSCPQMLTPTYISLINLTWTFGNEDVIFVPESEDCLTVNIWSPSMDRKQNTSVLVWIYGGALSWGNSRLPIYDGTNLVQDNDDVTIVSFNYRTNIFGQPNAPQLDVVGQPQNFGLLDVDAAIQWVHDNIANFGGDPNRITLFGQSAGGQVVDAYGFSHPNDTIVKGLIEISGNILIYNNNHWPVDPNNVPRINSTTWNDVAAAVGCGDAPTASQFSCMQKVPSKTLEGAVIMNNVEFGPVLDDVTYFQDFQERATAGKFLDVPLLAGTVTNEYDNFIVPLQLVTLGKTIPVLAETISDIATTALWTCPKSTELLELLHGGLQIFRYQYQAVFPDLSILPELRASHGSDLPIIFGTYNNSPIAPTATEIEFSKFMQSVYVGFARNPKQGLIDLGWPPYDPNAATLAQLGNRENATGFVLTKPDLIDILCPDRTVLTDAFLGFSSLPGLGRN